MDRVRHCGWAGSLAIALLLSSGAVAAQESPSGTATGWFDPLGTRRAQQARGLALGDLDGDSDLDLYTTYYNFEAAWRNEAGVFTIFNVVGTNDVRSVALGDLDGDGDLDAFVGGGEESNQGAPSRVRLNQGNLNFTDSGQALGQAETSSVALGDLDGDGDLDAVTLNEGAPNLVWVNQGNLQGGSEGTFQQGPQSLGNGVYGSLALGDLDGDGDLDVVIPVGGLVRVYGNDGTGVLTDSGAVLSTVPSSPHVALGDLDGDGDLDAFVSTATAETIWRNETPAMGPITFTDTGQRLGLDLRFASQGVALADLNADGDLDAVVARFPQSLGTVFLSDVPMVTVTVWFNDGTADFDLSGECFAPAAFLPAGATEGDPIILGWSESPVLGDLDGNGTIDLVTSHADGFRWWDNGAAVGTSVCCALERSAYGADAGLPPPPRSSSSTWSWARWQALGESLVSLLGGAGDIDVGIYFAVRDVLLPQSTNGQRYLDFYEAHNSELSNLLVANPGLLLDGASALGLWFDNLLALLDGSGASTVISAQEIDAIDAFLADVSAAGSNALSQAIAAELSAIPPLTSMVGLTMEEARVETIGPPLGSTIFEDGFESGDTSAWSAVVP